MSLQLGKIVLVLFMNDYTLKIINFHFPNYTIITVYYGKFNSVISLEPEYQNNKYYLYNVCCNNYE